MLFTRFLAENRLLTPRLPRAHNTRRSRTVGHEQGEPSLWTLAARFALYASRHLFPGRSAPEVRLAIEDRIGWKRSPTCRTKYSSPMTVLVDLPVLAVGTQS